MPDSFANFLTLLVIAVAVSAALHYGVKSYATPGLPSFFSKIVVAYLGALMSMSVFGTWFSGLAYAGVYILPAMLGALAILVLAVDVAKIMMRH